MFLASGCLSVSRNGGGGVHRGHMGEGDATVGLGGVTSRGGGMGAIMFNSGGGVQPLRTTLHTISISLQNSLS